MGWKDTITTSSWKDTVKDEVNPLESVARGAAQGASFNFADELTAALESGAGSLGIVPDKSYEQSLQESRQAYKTAEESNPEAYLGGEIGGGIATAFVPGLNAAKGASLATKLGVGAAQGAASGIGRAENLQEAGVGAALGGLAGTAGVGLAEGAGKLLSKGAEKLAPKLEGTIERFGQKAIGATAKQAEKIKPGTVKNMLEAGQIGWLDTAGDIAKNVEAPLNTATSQIDEALRASNQNINVSDFTTEIEDTIARLQSTPQGQPVARQLQTILNDIRATGKDSVGILEAETTKRAFNDRIKNWADAMSGAANKEAYDVYRSGVERAVDKFDPGTAKEFIDAKKTFGMLRPVQDIAEARQQQRDYSPMLSLKDALVAAAAGGDLKGVIAAVTQKVTAPRASSIAANATFRLQKALNSNLGAKYGATIKNALSRGQNAAAATDYLLQQTSQEYRQLQDE